MFQGWGFLLGEIWLLLAVAALIGLIVGWLIWGRVSVATGDNGAAEAALRAELDACRARGRDAEARLAALGADLAAARTQAAMAAETMAAPVAETMAAPVADAAAAVAVATAVEEVGTKPTTLSAPRGGAPDDLKLIKGIGPKLEALCNRLGFWHFDQIANWSAEEIAWVDVNLEAFKGRVTRDDWVAQARVLAAQTRPAG